jgi:hypothetical protein
MAVNKEKIKQLLGTGLSNEIVASAVGCDQSYISQLLADEQFAAEVTALRVVALTANSERDKNIDSIEDRLIGKLSEAVDMGLIYKPGDVLRSFAVVNAAKRRGVAAHEGAKVREAVVTLTIPTVVINQFVTNTLGEVIEVDGQTLVTKPSSELLKELAGKGGDNAGKYEKVSRYLPGATDERVIEGIAVEVR